MRNGYNMIRVAITPKAFEAIKATLAGAAAPPAMTTEGNVLVWLPSPVLDKLDALRGPKESTSDVILRMAALEEAA